MTETELETETSKNQPSWVNPNWVILAGILDLYVPLETFDGMIGSRRYLKDQCNRAPDQNPIRAVKLGGRMQVLPSEIKAWQERELERTGQKQT